MTELEVPYRSFLCNNQSGTESCVKPQQLPALYKYFFFSSFHIAVYYTQVESENVRKVRKLFVAFIDLKMSGVVVLVISKGWIKIVLLFICLYGNNLQNIRLILYTTVLCDGILFCKQIIILGKFENHCCEKRVRYHAKEVFYFAGCRIILYSSCSYLPQCINFKQPISITCTST